MTLSAWYRRLVVVDMHLVLLQVNLVPEDGVILFTHARRALDSAARFSGVGAEDCVARASGLRHFTKDAMLLRGEIGSRRKDGQKRTMECMGVFIEIMRVMLPVNQYRG